MARTALTGTGTAGTPQRLHKPRTDVPSASELAFPGCKPVRLPREELELYDGRLEFRDGAIETAWVCEPNSPCHEKPGGVLPSLVERITQVRGSPITCYGSMDLMARNAGGLAWRILQADQSVYLHPGRARLPGAVAIVDDSNRDAPHRQRTAVTGRRRAMTDHRPRSPVTASWP